MKNLDGRTDTTVPGNRQMRIVLLPPMPWQPERSSFAQGSSPDVFEVYRQLAAAGIETELVDPYGWPWNPFAGKSTLLASLDPSRALKILMRYRNVDAVISIFEGAAAPLGLLRRAFLFRPKILLWDIGLTEAWRLRERVLDIVVPRCDGIMALGSNQIGYIKQRWPNAPAVAAIGHHVDTDFFVAAPASNDGPVLAIGDDVGRDFATLVAAVEGLDDRFEIKTRLAVPPAPNVTVLRERLSYPQLRDLYAKSRFVVVPVHDTLNASGVSSILEAAASGRALIVSDSAGIRDFIVPDETCLVVPLHDPPALRRAIERLTIDTGLRDRLAANARRFAVEHLSKPAFARRLATTIRSLVETGSPEAHSALVSS